MAIPRDTRKTACALSMSRLSSETVYVTVTPAPGTPPISSSTITVDLAFPFRDADPSVWYPAALADDNGSVIAGVLVGPTGPTGALALGSYGIWMRVTEASETPIRKIGSLAIY